MENVAKISLVGLYIWTSKFEMTISVKAESIIVPILVRAIIIVTVGVKVENVIWHKEF